MSPVKCPRCTHANPAAAKFCSECGARLAATCAHCGHELLPDGKFCSECGQPAGSAPRAASVAAADRYQSPTAYTPKHLADRILTSRIALEGERKQVTVLFAGNRSPFSSPT
ncbi:MAG: zinc ribbon domain-containing protein [Candidatus Rokubacteria bacterium]|nr:zinc ribbon domain-containing protein [Candidatus Rokubacteria bacterium]